MNTTTDIDPKVFGARLRAEVKRRGATLSGCARATGVTPSAVSQWAAGIALPARERRGQLAGWLGVDLAWLEHGEGPQAETPQAPSPATPDELAEATREVDTLRAEYETSATETVRLGRDLSEAERRKSELEAEHIKRARGHASPGVCVPCRNQATRAPAGSGS